MATMAARRVTQETFDETVRENMDEFDMDHAEALQDAVEQFKSQGVDLTSIDTSGSAERQEERAELLRCIGVVTAASAGGVSTDDIHDALASIAAMCTCEPTKRSKALRASVLVGGGLGALATLIRACVDGERVASVGVAARAAVALRACIAGDAENRDAARSANVVNTMAGLLRAALNEAGADELLVAGLDLVSAVCFKAEENKSAFTKQKGGELLVRAHRAHATDAVVAAACARAMCSVTAADDARSSTSCTFDVSRALVLCGACEGLLESARAFLGACGGGAAAEAEALGLVLDAMRHLSKSDDAVKLLRKRRVLEICDAVLRAPRAALDAHVVGLLRNLASNDDAKDDMCTHGILELLCAVLRRGADDAVVREHGIATFAQMALRRPPNALRIVRCGGIELIVESMRRHAGCVTLQRQGCLAVRNLCARSDELARPLLDAGAEAVLRQAGAASQANVDVAYAALRDLGVDAQISVFEADQGGGSGVVRIEKDVYGGGAAANFRAIFDESCDVGAQIAACDDLDDGKMSMSNMALM
ncbi:armadillo-type protein [Pelagophyceae sp. CCMP2097]|nr:armadillo-type protein [Pelagophyceae sp. CCMP2097]